MVRGSHTLSLSSRTCLSLSRSLEPWSQHRSQRKVVGDNWTRKAGNTPAFRRAREELRSTVTWVSSCRPLDWGLAQMAVCLTQGDHFPVTLRGRLSLAGKLSIQELASCGASLDSHTWLCDSGGVTSQGPHSHLFSGSWAFSHGFLKKIKCVNGGSGPVL